MNSLDSDIFVVGTDFHQQTFIDKKMNVIFCNPPYSEFTEWSIKLIEEANSRGEFKTFLPHFVNINNNIMLQLMDEGFKVYYGEWGANMGSCLIIEW